MSLKRPAWRQDSSGALAVTPPFPAPRSGAERAAVHTARDPGLPSRERAEGEETLPRGARPAGELSLGGYRRVFRGLASGDITRIREKIELKLGSATIEPLFLLLRTKTQNTIN